MGFLPSFLEIYELKIRNQTYVVELVREGEQNEEDRSGYLIYSLKQLTFNRILRSNLTLEPTLQREREIKVKTLTARVV